MTCRDFAEFIGDYLANELPADTLASFERHLTRCDNCRRYLAIYQRTVTVGRAAFEDIDEALPADVPNELVEAILAARRKPS